MAFIYIKMVFDINKEREEERDRSLISQGISINQTFIIITKNLKGKL